MSKKSIYQLTLLSITACAIFCGSAFAKETVSVSLPAILKSDASLSIKLATGATKMGTAINSTGYTIVGVIFVAGVIAKNKENSALFFESQKENFKENPLREIFNNELQNTLTTLGVTLTAVSPPKKNEDGVIAFDASVIKTRWALWTELLSCTYVAEGSTAPYRPVGNISVFIQDMEDKNAKLQSFSVIEVLNDPKYTFNDFGSLQADTKLAYAGMAAAVDQLAKRIAKEIRPVEPSVVVEPVVIADPVPVAVTPE